MLSALAALMLHLDIYADIFDEDLDGVADRPDAASQGDSNSVLDLRKWPLNCRSICSPGVTQVLSVLVICLHALRDVTSLAESDPAKPSPA